MEESDQQGQERLIEINYKIIDPNSEFDPEAFKGHCEALQILLSDNSADIISLMYKPKTAQLIYDTETGSKIESVAENLRAVAIDKLLKFGRKQLRTLVDIVSDEAVLKLCTEPSFYSEGDEKYNATSRLIQESRRELKELDSEKGGLEYVQRVAEGYDKEVALHYILPLGKPIIEAGKNQANEKLISSVQKYGGPKKFFVDMVSNVGKQYDSSRSKLEGLVGKQKGELKGEQGKLEETLKSLENEKSQKLTKLRSSGLSETQTGTASEKQINEEYKSKLEEAKKNFEQVMKQAEERYSGELKQAQKEMQEIGRSYQGIIFTLYQFVYGTLKQKEEQEKKSEADSSVKPDFT